MPRSWYGAPFRPQRLDEGLSLGAIRGQSGCAEPLRPEWARSVRLRLRLAGSLRLCAFALKFDVLGQTQGSRLRALDGVARSIEVSRNDRPHRDRHSFLAGRARKLLVVVSGCAAANSSLVCFGTGTDNCRWAKSLNGYDHRINFAGHQRTGRTACPRVARRLRVPSRRRRGAVHRPGTSSQLK